MRAELLRTPDGQVWGAAIRMTDEPHPLRRPAVVDRLFRGIGTEARMGRGADAPANDLSGMRADDDG